MERNTYKCEKCGNTLLKTNKFLHDLKCTSPKKNLNFFSNSNNINNNYININEIDSYTCTICGVCINLKDKTDHLLCHQLEEETNQKNDNEDNSMISESISGDEEIRPNVVNNININIINNNGHNIHKSYRIRENLNNSNSYGDNEDKYSDDEFNNEKNSLNENEEIEDYEENEGYDSYDDDNYSDEDHGIDDNTIKTYPVSKIKDISKLTDEKKRCCICLENFKKNDEIMNLPCVHIFHSNCIKKWMKRQDICPICKNKII